MRNSGLSGLDRLIIELDSALRVVTDLTAASRPNPGGEDAQTSLSAAEQTKGAALMRVNHAGEVAAQALYRGQAFTTRDPGIRRRLLDAAQEEQDHLTWCRQRVNQLDGRTSLLGPFWYAGGFAIGAVAGLLGTSAGLGFVVETERQVEEHLSGHLDRLPDSDLPSRKILRQIQADEAAHGAKARELGGTDLPAPVRTAMRLAARFMTTVAHRL